MTAPDSILDRARKLLALAQHPNTPPHEAENAEKAAERLITKYAIDTALLAQKQDLRVSPIVRTVVGEAPYAMAKASLLSAIGKAYDVQVVVVSNEEGDGTAKRCKVVGFESDLDVVDLLYTNLLLQATSGMLRTGISNKAGRRAFLLAFAQRVGERLQETRRKEIADNEPGTALVLRDRALDVKSKVAEEFPRLRTIKTSYSDRRGASLGRQAGNAANLSTGGNSIGNRRGALSA